MDNFLKQAASTEWWISVVVVGILVNLASAAIQYLFPLALSSIGRRWQNRSAETAKRRALEVAQASSSDQELYFALLKLNALKLDVLFAYLQALVFLAFAFFAHDALPAIHSVAMLLAVLSLVQGLNTMVRHGQYSLVVLDAQSQYRQRRSVKPM